MRRLLTATVLAAGVALTQLTQTGCGVLEVEDSGPKVTGTAGQGDMTPPPAGLAVTLEYPPGVGSYRYFPFEGAQDPVSQDLARIMRHRRMHYEDGEAHGAALDEVEAAKARLAADAPTAVTVIAAALGRLGPDDVDGHVDLIGLVEVVRDDPSAVALLEDLVMTQSPPPDPYGAGSVCSEVGAGGTPSSCEDTDPFQRVQERAVRSLDETARLGSALARTALLTAAGSPNLAVRKMAVRSTYALSHSRRLAKDQLRGVLDPDEHYLLNRY